MPHEPARPAHSDSRTMHGNHGNTVSDTIESACSNEISNPDNSGMAEYVGNAVDVDTTTGSFPRRDFLSGVLAIGAVAVTRSAAGASHSDGTMLGPIVGHCDDSTAVLWIRAAAAGDYSLEVTPAAGGTAILVDGQATEADDLCVHWHVGSLQPATEYRYRILSGGKEIVASPGLKFRTAGPPEAPAKVRLAISSCAREDQSSRDVWNRMATEQVDGVVLLGDTPYIDSTDLSVQTQRHREFAAVAEYQSLLSGRPCWWTWDDHDFAGNDSSGLAKGKENSRLAFTRYRPQVEFGENGQGIYTRFRRGPVEVFMLDTRWFSMTEASFASPHRPTLLGRQQWEWLVKGLLQSTAPFKLLAGGVIWDDKENTESDDWGSYRHERAAIEKFIGDNKISGVVFLGGDIHASRVLRYKTKKAVGYDLVQLIASPIHSSTIPSLNVYHPDLIRSAVEPNVFLRLDADSTVTPATLTASLINRKGETVFSYMLSEADLSPAK